MGLRCKQQNENRHKRVSRFCATSASLVYLANWFPPGHFDGKDAEVYFEEFIADRYLYHRALHEPNGPGTGGTVAGLLAASGALDDVLRAIFDLVAAQAPGEFDFDKWRERWQESQQRPAEARSP
jgi:hypothetical protein